MVRLAMGFLAQLLPLAVLVVCIILFRAIIVVVAIIFVAALVLLIMIIITIIFVDHLDLDTQEDSHHLVPAALHRDGQRPGHTCHAVCRLGRQLIAFPLVWSTFLLFP